MALIRNVNNPALFWSNSDGWIGIESADSFTAEERASVSLPIEGEWLELSMEEFRAYLEAFIRGYKVCAVWSSTDEDGSPLDDEYSTDDFSADSNKEIAEECADFVSANWSDLQQYSKEYETGHKYGIADCAGHDFWLTRNGHGVGFWDRGLGELGERLSRAAKVYGECYVFPDEAGELHIE